MTGDDKTQPGGGPQRPLPRLRETARVRRFDALDSIPARSAIGPGIESAAEFWTELCLEAPQLAVAGKTLGPRESKSAEMPLVDARQRDELADRLLVGLELCRPLAWDEERSRFMARIRCNDPGLEGLTLAWVLYDGSADPTLADARWEDVVESEEEHWIAALGAIVGTSADPDAPIVATFVFPEMEGVDRTKVPPGHSMRCYVV